MKEYIGIYTGSRKDLYNKGALIHIDENNKCSAQFNALFLPEAFGWHQFDIKDFSNLEELNILLTD